MQGNCFLLAELCNKRYRSFEPSQRGIVCLKPQKDPTVVQGELNLTQWDLQRDGEIKLSGQWSFYWESFLNSVDFERLDTGQSGKYAAYSPQTIVFQPAAKEFEIVVPVSNYLYARGGIWNGLKLGMITNRLYSI